MTDDPYNLKRFVMAQEPIFDIALAELKAGNKRGHWMWFVFPQLRGLGHSPTANSMGSPPSTRPAPISSMTCWGPG